MAVMSSSSRAWPRTIRLPPGSPAQVARPDSITRAVMSLSSARFSFRSSRISRRASSKVRPTQPRVQVVGRLDQHRGRHADRRVDDAVLDLARLRHRHHQGAARPELHELDVLQRLLGLGRHDHAGAARQAGQQRRRLFERFIHAAADGGAARLDALALLFRDVADFEQAVDEQPQPGVGRQAAGRGVRRVEQAEILQVGHDVADGGR